MVVVTYVLFFALSAGLLLGTQPLPTEPLGSGPPPRFDAARAYALVAEIAARFPGRVTGTPTDAAAARWVGEQLGALGLVVSEQRFRAFGATDRLAWGWHEGVNVTGVHPGQTDAIILFGAHRDIAPTSGPGADDNASGTAVLLELARALTATPHRYTYVFVSFGAEEIGLGGSAHFAAHWPDLPRLRLMLNFDMLGWRDAVATRVEHWTYLPLPATALLRAMAAREPDAIQLSRAKTLWQVAGLIEPGSDSAPFALRGYPVLFFVDGPPRPGAPPHCYHAPCDTVEQVSAEALGRAGRFAEEYVRRVERGDYLDGPRAFLLRGDQYVPAGQVQTLGLLVAAFAAAQLALAAMADLEARTAAFRMPTSAIRHPAGFWLGAAGGAALVAVTAPLPGLGATPAGPRLALWGAVALVVTLGLAALRRRLPAGPPAAERLALTGALVAAYTVAVVASGWLPAALAALPHLLLTSRVRLAPGWRPRLMDLLIAAPGCAWSALWLAGALGVGVAQLLPLSTVLAGVALGYLGAVAPAVAVLGRGRPPPPGKVTDL